MLRKVDFQLSDRGNHPVAIKYTFLLRNRLIVICNLAYIRAAWQRGGMDSEESVSSQVEDDFALDCKSASDGIITPRKALPKSKKLKLDK
jgi:hypothetical protein